MKAIIEFTERGGIMMWPLYLVSLIAIFMMIERAIAFYRFRKKELSFFKDLKEDGFSVIHSHSKKFVPAHVFSRKLDEEHTFSELQLELEAELGRFKTGLTIIYKIAPLMGLLGTVLGMIKVFQQMSSSGLEQTAYFAGGISEALLTTASGLVIAIPTLIFTFYQHALLSQKVIEYETIYMSFSGKSE